MGIFIKLLCQFHFRRAGCSEANFQCVGTQNFLKAPRGNLKSYLTLSNFLVHNCAYHFLFKSKSKRKAAK